MKFAMNLTAIQPAIIVGIIVGVLVVVGIIAVVAVVLHNKRKKDAMAITNTVRPVANADLPEPAPQPEKVEEPPVEDDYDKISSELEKAHEELDSLSAQLDKTEEEVVSEEEVPAEEPVEAVEEVAVQPEPEPEPVPEPEPEPAPQPKPVKKASGEKIAIRVRYNRSLTAKLIQSDDTVKNYYSEIKNELMRYKKVHNRMSWRHETFRLGRKLLVRMTMRGKTLNLYLALNPADYADTKYKVADVSSVAKNASVPTQYKIKNDRRCRYAKQLIADLMAQNGVEVGEEVHEDYAAQYPYEEIEPLIDRNLVKLVPWKEFSFGSEVGVINVAEEDITEEIAAASEQHNRVAPEGKILIRVRYNRSFTARLIQSGDITKNYYAEIKNELLRYKKVHNRVSWRYETFRLGRKLIAKLAIRGKTLNVYFALDPAQFADTKYKVDDVSATVSNREVPTRYKIKNDRRCHYAKDLIAMLMAQYELQAGEEVHEVDPAQYPYEEIEPLIDRNLVKLVPWKEFVSGSEVGVIAVAEEDITEEIAAAAEQPADEETIEEQPVEELEEEEIEEEIEEPVEEEPVEEEVEEVVEEPVEEVIEEQPEEPVEEEVEEQPVEEVVEDDEEEESVANFFNEEEPAAETEEMSSEVDMSINVVEADEILDDTYVEAFVRQGSRVSDKSKKAIVNIDTLGKYFEAGEVVTVAEMRDRIPAIGKNVTYVKVLARGVLNKALTVEADDFSPQAIKMIVLTGGSVIRTKNN